VKRPILATSFDHSSPCEDPKTSGVEIFGPRVVEKSNFWISWELERALEDHYNLL
jgi:hypothetical protein